MRKTDHRRTVLHRGDCQEVALGLRVLGRRLEIESALVMHGRQRRPVLAQVERLRQIAGRFDEAGPLDFSFEGVTAATRQGERHTSPNVLDFSPTQLRVAAEALRLLKQRLKAAGDEHAALIGDLGKKMQDAARYMRGLLRCLAELKQAAEGDEEEARSI